MNVRIVIRSAFVWFLVYSASVLVVYIVFPCTLWRLPIGPELLTLLNTAIRGVVRLSVLFMTGFTVVKKTSGNGVAYAAIAGTIVATLMLLPDLLIFWNVGLIAIRSWFGSVAGLIFLLATLGLQVGVALLGGLIGQRLKRG